MITLMRLWSNSDDSNNITLLNRPRISIKVDEYVWGIIEQNIVIPKKVMQSDCYDYNLVVSLEPYTPERMRFAQQSPYNGLLKEEVISTYQTPHKLFSRADFVDGEKRTTWYHPQKFWINGGKKTVHIRAHAEKVSEKITPLEYVDVLFDAFAATLLYNFKKLNKSEFDELKTCVNPDIVCSFPFPAPFCEQRYIGDGGSYRVTRLDNGEEEILIDIPSIEQFYKLHYRED